MSEEDPLLIEVAWEVCNKIGGIYTVLRSKAPSMVNRWGERYCLIGPYAHDTAHIEFEADESIPIFGELAQRLREAGVPCQVGRWIITGKPTVILIDYLAIFHRLHEIKYRLWDEHRIQLPSDDELINNTVALGDCIRVAMQVLAAQLEGRRKIVAHFHEWMGGVAIPLLRNENWPGAIVFTTHATLLGRYLASSSAYFYAELPNYSDSERAEYFNVKAQHDIERAAAHGCHIFSTVSDVTADECTHLLGRTPDVLVPNGININRFEALHRLQELHGVSKEKIHEFAMGHFFPSYRFDLDKTLYFFTSGRFEYRNKGMDITLEALARLNHRLQVARSDITVVAFVITRRPVHSIHIDTLQSRSMLDEFRTVTSVIKEQIGERLFMEAARGEIPDLNSLVDEYWMLRLKRMIHAWGRNEPPSIVTHDVMDDEKDPVLNQLRSNQLWNRECERVKVIYHPDFISPTSPLWGIEYDDFVRGCHLGVFPSYYEPWGYTPLESLALGVPAVTSDLAGFGSYSKQMIPDHERHGLYLVPRRNTDDDSAAEVLTNIMFSFCELNRRERIELRNRSESLSIHFDWNNLSDRYHEAHRQALERIS